MWGEGDSLEDGVVLSKLPEHIVNLSINFLTELHKFGYDLLNRSRFAGALAGTVSIVVESIMKHNEQAEQANHNR